MNFNKNEIKELHYRVANMDMEVRNIVLEQLQTESARRVVEIIRYRNKS
jgi:hypothetical protein